MGQETDKARKATRPWAADAWSRWGAALIVAASVVAVICSLTWHQAPVPSSAITTGRDIGAAQADARLWTACRQIIWLLGPFVAVALLAWVGAVESCRGQSATCASPWLMLGALWGFLALNHGLYLLIDRRTPYWDMANHLGLSLRYLRMSSLSDLVATIRAAGPYPPLFHLATLPFYWVFGTSEDVAALVNLAALALLLAATYGIGAYVHDRATGLLGAFLVSMYPIVLGLSRKYLIDVTLMAMVAASVYALVRSEGFRRKRYAVLFGVLFALGMLTKRGYPLYMVGPLLWAFWQFVSRKPSRGAVGLVLAGLVVLALVAPWYGIKAGILSRYLRGHLLLGGGSKVANIRRIGESLAYYGRALDQQQLLFAFTALFAIASLAALWRRRRENALLLTWVGVSYALLAVISTNDGRFPMPFLPGVALLSADWIMQVRWQAGRRALIAAVAGMALLELVVQTYGAAALPAPVQLPRILKWHSPLGVVTLYSERAHIALSAQPWEWQVPRIMDDIAHDMAASGSESELRLGIIPNRAAFEPGTFRYYAALKRVPVAVIGLGRDADYEARMAACRYVVAKTGGQGRPELNAYAAAATAALRDAGNPLAQRFQMIGEYVLPDKSVVYLYRKK